MGLNLAQKLIAAHLVEGEAVAGNPVGLQFEQTLCQDATGTLVMLTLEAMKLDKVATLSVQYVDHNLLQEDHKNPDDHLFLKSAAQKFGLWYSRPGNGISHPLHTRKFAKPGSSLIGSDSHTCASGCMGMLAIGSGGTDIALAMAGEPIMITMPEVFGVHLTGTLPDWVSAKDVILEMLRRHDVDGGVGRIIEYYGSGVENLSMMDRHVIANMGAELGATATVFPSDAETKRFLRSEGRVDDWRPLSADPDCQYEIHDEIDLSTLEPLIAKPSSPGNVVSVSSVAGEPIYQSYIGSSANPSYRDFAIAAEIVKGQVISDDVSFDINPSSRHLLQQLSKSEYLTEFLNAGARIHQAGCNGCIGMGQAPATGKNSLRTTPRNFPGRSGTKEDRVWLCSPETAAASALKGRIVDPRTLPTPYPDIKPAPEVEPDNQLFVAPIKGRGNRDENAIIAPSAELHKGPNIVSIPEVPALAEQLESPILLKLGDNVSTDEILPAGAEVLPYRSNIPKIAEFCFRALSDRYVKQAQDVMKTSGHCIIAGKNYGQGSSREHAALAPRSIGLQVVVAISFARIHWQNLINFGVLPLTFADPTDFAKLTADDTLTIKNVREQLVDDGNDIDAWVSDQPIKLTHQLSSQQRNILLAGGVIPWIKARKQH